MNRDTALVTGASAGIGKALAERFAAEDQDVVLVARREAKLQTLAEDLRTAHDVQATAISMDLATRDSPFDLHDTIHEHELQIDVLVNNVGIGTQGRFVEIDPDREGDQMQLNIVTPTQLAKLFGREMADRGRGRILNVASTAAFQPGPYMAVYYASKAYMLSLSEAIAEELRTDGVTVTALCPGPVDTEFQERAGNTDTPIGSGSMQSLEKVAAAGYAGTMRGKPVVIVGAQYKLLARLARLLPKPITRKLAARLNH